MRQNDLASIVQSVHPRSVNLDIIYHFDIFLVFYMSLKAGRESNSRPGSSNRQKKRRALVGLL